MQDVAHCPWTVLLKLQTTPLGQPLPYFNVDKLMTQLHIVADVDKRMADIKTFNKQNR